MGILFSKEDRIKKRNTIISTLLIIVLGISVYFYKKGSLERINAAIEKAENRAK